MNAEEFKFKLKFTHSQTIVVDFLADHDKQLTEGTRMELTLTIKDGATNKDIANQLRWHANLIDGMEPKEASAVKNTTGTKTTPAKKTTAAAAPAATDEDDDFKTDTGPESNGFDDDDEPVAEASFDDAGGADDEEKAAPANKKTAAKAKTKKPTLDDVNDACKAHAEAKGRDATLAILQKKFKTKTVSTLKPEQFEAVIAAMAV